MYLILLKLLTIIIFCGTLETSISRGVRTTAKRGVLTSQIITVHV